MPITINIVTDGLANIFKFIFGTLSNFIVSLTGDFGEIILLAIAIFGAWYFIRQADKDLIKKWIVILVISLLIWLILKLSLLSMEGT